jgi:hypothetical protein
MIHRHQVVLAAGYDSERSAHRCGSATLVMAVMSVGMSRRLQIASAGLQLVWKFREQLNLGDAECASGGIIRRAQCEHRPYKAPIGVVEIRGAAPQCRQCGQCVLERLHARSDRLPLSARSGPRSASTDPSRFRHFQPFELLATKRSPIPKGTRATVALSRNRTRAGEALTPPALRSCALVASSYAPVRPFAGRHDHNTITSNSAHSSTNVNFSSCGGLTALRHPGGIRKRGRKGDGGGCAEV